MLILFSLPFSSGVFPCILKIVKVVLIFKKDSKLDCQNNSFISLLSDIAQNIPEKLMEKYIHFLTITFTLTFIFRKEARI